MGFQIKIDLGDSLASMKTSSEGKANHVNHSGNDNDGKAKNDYGLCVKEEEDFEGEREREGGHSEKEEEEEEGEEEIVLCSKTDGKGWQCGRVVKKGKKICDHHLAQVQNYGKDKKKSRANVVEKRAQRRPRPKKPEANPYEFYYYSGFGPSWGKKRGIPGGLGQGYKDTVDGAKVASSSSNASDLCDSSYINCDKSTTSSSDMRFDGDTKLCYIEYEDDEDEDEEEEIKVGISGKKRGRKPIKARSLKSLM